MWQDWGGACFPPLLPSSSPEEAHALVETHPLCPWGSKRVLLEFLLGNKIGAGLRYRQVL